MVALDEKSGDFAPVHLVDVNIAKNFDLLGFILSTTYVFVLSVIMMYWIVFFRYFSLNLSDQLTWPTGMAKNYCHYLEMKCVH